MQQCIGHQLRLTGRVSLFIWEIVEAGKALVVPARCPGHSLLIPSLPPADRLPIFVLAIRLGRTALNTALLLAASSMLYADQLPILVPALT